MVNESNAHPVRGPPPATLSLYAAAPAPAPPPSAPAAYPTIHLPQGTADGTGGPLHGNGHRIGFDFSLLQQQHEEVAGILATLSLNAGTIAQPGSQQHPYQPMGMGQGEMMSSTTNISGGPYSSFAPALAPGAVHLGSSIPPFVPPQQQPNFYLPPAYPGLPPIVPPPPGPWPGLMVGPGQFTGGAADMVGALPPSQPAMNLKTTVRKQEVLCSCH